MPDGFLGPQTYIPATAAAAGCWAYGWRRVKRTLREEAIPRVAALTALSFVLMLVLIPLPGGTSAHVTGIAILAVLFGVWTTFLAVSLVLLLQALLLGCGGVTVLPVNALAMGLVGGAAALAAYRLVRRAHDGAALVLAGWASLVAPAFLIALVLGLQATIATAPDGSPRFFPFGIAVTLPSIVIPHALLGVGEGILTLLVVRLFRRIDSP